MCVIAHANGGSRGPRKVRYSLRRRAVTGTSEGPTGPLLTSYIRAMVEAVCVIAYADERRPAGGAVCVICSSRRQWDPDHTTRLVGLVGHLKSPSDLYCVCF